MLRKLRDFPAHSIVNVNGMWGVVCINFGNNFVEKNHRTVDFWEGGRESVPSDMLVMGLPKDNNEDNY